MLWYTVFSVVIIIISIFLILIVLVQNSKGGGLAAGFTSSNQYMGVRKTADFLEKATWTLASGLLVLCIVSSIVLRASGDGTRRSAIDEQVRNTQDPSNNMPGIPAANSNQKSDKKTIPIGTSKEKK